MACHFYGPYQIIQKTGLVVYKLQLPPEARIRPVFHVSMLKKKVGEVPSQPDALSAMTDECEMTLQPELVLDACCTKRGSRIMEENLVKLKQLPREDDT